jgi:hypothetical protein
MKAAASACVVAASKNWPPSSVCVISLNTMTQLSQAHVMLFFIQRPPTLLPVHCCGHFGWGPWLLVTNEALDEGCNAGNQEEDDDDEVTDDNLVADDEDEGFDDGNGHKRFDQKKKLFVICHFCM